MPMATKLGRMVNYCEGFSPVKSHDPFGTWSCEITWQTKTLYARYHNVCDHKASQDGDIPLEAPTHKIIRSFNCVVL